MHAEDRPGWLEHESERPWPHGMDHALQDLDVLLREAHATGRLALLPALDLDRKHNFGTWHDWQWDWYFDLGASRLIDAAGNAHPLPVASRPPPDGVRTLIVGPGEPVPVSAGSWPRLVRRYATPAIDPPPDLPARNALRLDLVHSRAVRELARETVAEIARLDAGRFVALHVRRGDRLWQYPRALTEPDHLGDVLLAHVPEGSVVFAMSDERDPAFWEPLKRHYRLVRYPDFPRLAALVSETGDRRPDNYLLYEVENAIASRARMLFSTFPRGLVAGRAREDRALAGEVTGEMNRWRRKPGEANRRPDPGPRGGAAGRGEEPLWYNDWRQVPVPPAGTFTPWRAVSVVVWHPASQKALERTLGALAGQSWPLDLLEVVIVDMRPAGAPAAPAASPLKEKYVHLEDHAGGRARARNAGARAAAHDILVFLDAGMLPEPGWLAAHARWHHALPDALTIGLRARVPVDAANAPAASQRRGRLAETFAGRKAEPSKIESYLRRTGDLTSKADDPFRVLEGASIGIRREFHEQVGGFDESCAPCGMDDTEFGYRAHVRGALLVPLRDALAFHEAGPEKAGKPGETGPDASKAKAEAAHRIAHRAFRRGLPDRRFTVPRFVVTIDADGAPGEAVRAAVERVLSGPVHDLVVRVEAGAARDAAERLRHQLAPDPRVQVAPDESALDAFPASPFHVALPGATPWRADIVRRLRRRLGDAVMARSMLPDGSPVSIVRAWALHRARRTPWEPRDFGEVVTIPFRDLQPAAARSPAGRAPRTVTRTRPSAWSGPSPWYRADRALGAEVVALGPRARAVFAASRRVARTTNGRHVDVVVADTAADAPGGTAPSVVLAQAPARLSVPAFDPRVHNPTGWQRRGFHGVAALGPLEHLPPDSPADRVVPSEESRGIRWIPPTKQVLLRGIHHLEDVQAFHRDAAARAAEIARLAATGVVVHLADGGPGLEPLLGAELFGLMTAGVRDLDAAGREALSVRMRRAALRGHSLESRVRQAAELVLPDPPRLPLVSIVVATGRPERLDWVLGAVRRQGYPRLELVLALRGEGFGNVGPGAAGPAVPVTVLGLDAGLALGPALDAATRASRGRYVTRMDDDGVYGGEHVEDLVLAQDYSQAELVGKASEFLYLAGAGRTVRRPASGAEQFETIGSPVDGAAVLVARRAYDRTGGWARSAPDACQSLVADVVRAGGRIYRTHPLGFMRVRRGDARGADDVSLLKQAELSSTGWRPDLAGIDEGLPPPIP